MRLLLIIALVWIGAFLLGAAVAFATWPAAVGFWPAAVGFWSR